MTRCSIQTRDGKDISKELCGKYIQKRFDHAKQYATDVIKTTSNRVFQKTAEAAGGLICNKIADRITKVSNCYVKNVGIK